MATNRKKRSSIFRLATPFFLSFILLSTSFAIAESDLRFYVTANLGCSSCVEDLQPLLDLYGDKVTTYDIREGDNATRFSTVVSLIDSKAYEIPLTVVFEGKRLTAIVFGTHPPRDWGTIVDAEHNGVPVYSNLHDSAGKITHDTTLTDQNVTLSIAKLFIDDPVVDGYIDFYGILPIIAMAALVDAINPCEFYVLVVFLSIIFFRIGRKNVLKSGISYAAAIFVVYYLMGLVLLGLTSYLQQMRIFVVAAFGFLGLVVGLREILGFVLRREPKRVPDVLSDRLSARLKNVSKSPFTGFMIGLVSGVFLLPCTSGPYFVAVSFITNLGRFFEGLILLTIYNSIVITPFIAITLCVYTLKMKTGELKRWSTQKQRWVNLISGLVITLLSLYLLSTIIL
jgi:cytochrome c biogenesis protein CcdA